MAFCSGLALVLQTVRTSFIESATGYWLCVFFFFIGKFVFGPGAPTDMPPATSISLARMIIQTTVNEMQNMQGRILINLVCNLQRDKMTDLQFIFGRVLESVLVQNHKSLQQRNVPALSYDFI
uniref:Putative secreted peptide n=1 Tax=Anopheles braziliensis TaxID=58242 RepID=A0A2M3ZNL9_9DIPT